jgi:ATP-dependent RNA helicase DDX19/DBP5
VRNEHPLSEL